MRVWITRASGATAARGRSGDGYDERDRRSVRRSSAGGPGRGRGEVRVAARGDLASGRERDVPCAKRQQAGRLGEHEGGRGPGGRETAGRIVGHDARKHEARRDGQDGAGQRDARESQPSTGPDTHHRVRMGRPLRAASRSRSDFAGHNRTSARAGGPTNGLRCT